jgi:hypothetical protein
VSRVCLSRVCLSRVCQCTVWKAFGMMAKIQEGLMSAVVDLGALGPQNEVEGRAAPGSGNQNMGAGSGGGASGGGAEKRVPPREATQDMTEKTKLKQSLREAEKKLVVFNLNLGKAPVMNKDTLAKNVVLDLDSKVREGKHDYHIGDAVDVVDDILSCSTLDFMGASTRKFYNTKNLADPRNEKMYTMPVKMEFKDKDVRLQAELSLRKICHVNCAVPYPKPVRTMLDALIADGKKKSLALLSAPVSTLTASRLRPLRVWIKSGWILA